jgi:hypothetical protein
MLEETGRRRQTPDSFSSGRANTRSGWRGHHQHFNPSQVHPHGTVSRSLVRRSAQSPLHGRPSPHEVLDSFQYASITLSSNAWPATHVSQCMFRRVANRRAARILAMQGSRANEGGWMRVLPPTDGSAARLALCAAEPSHDGPRLRGIAAWRCDRDVMSLHEASGYLLCRIGAASSLTDGGPSRSPQPRSAPKALHLPRLPRWFHSAIDTVSLRS